MERAACIRHIRDEQIAGLELPARRKAWGTKVTAVGKCRVPDGSSWMTCSERGRIGNSPSVWARQPDRHQHGHQHQEGTKQSHNESPL